MEALFDCTLDMLNKDLEEFPEHRLNFFRMLQAFTTHCFPCMLQYSQKCTINFVVQLFFLFLLNVLNCLWMLLCGLSNIQWEMLQKLVCFWYDTVLINNSFALGLNVLFTLLQKFSLCATAAEFFKLYFLDLMQHIFAVVTDTSHTASRQPACFRSSTCWIL